MKVRFIKSWNDNIKQDWFTVGKEYEVIKKDEDGDYWVLDDNRSKAVLLRSEVEVSDSIVESVINQFKQRSEAGINKYRTTLDRNDLTPLQWLTHLSEELQDATLYIEKLKQELK